MDALQRLHVEAKLQTVDFAQRTISGYAAVFDNTDLVGDVIDQRAFRKTLSEKRPQDVDVFIAHQSEALPVGVPIVIEADQRGLYTVTKVKPGPVGDDLLYTAQFMMEHGRTLGESIGYKTRASKREIGPEGKMRRRLLDIDLREYSYASSQLIANPLALVDGVKQVTAGGSMKYTIEPRGGEFVLLDADGEVEGRFPTHAAAEAERRRLMRDGDEPDSPGPMGKTAPDLLPDSAFLYIAPGGVLDTEGKTVSRGLRHFPYRDASGAVDAAALRTAVATIPQATVPGLDAGDQGRLAARARRLLDQLDRGKQAEDDTAEWKQGAPLSVLAVSYALRDAAEQIATEHKAMTLLGDDTKAGQRVRGEMRAKLRELAKALSDIAEWAEYVDAERDGAAKIARYQRELDILSLAS